ncbi:DUF2889 domain-containing protein [Allopusillimonas ginsengisoli]|uniref:DUF2889 domain-containing protein n=1 Tax=Allopusillimonas ginsengisoli TaxID=453575 RepID=UPI0010210328|nr:DUF2889 domain-containing protein [Allopusillimonas ginsengisoli]TEA77292.1 DUF2889 domain-containing protein [Allopusillimonas ginsengisoli]
MPLPPPEIAREPLHTRSIRVDSYAREDGCWDLEAELIDVKAYDFSERAGTLHRAGDPVHHMHLRVTINDQFTIIDAVAAYDAAPYGPHCMSIAPDYRDLIGLNLLRKFREAVKARFGRTAGCTHMTELSYVLPTVAIQSMANRRRKDREAGVSGKKPFQLDGCHALRIDGEVAREFYPRWYIAPNTEAKCE